MFNKANIMEFFENYGRALKPWKFTADRVCNIEETGTATAVQSPSAVARIRTKQAGQSVSGERGARITVHTGPVWKVKTHN
jgi:hypothetical protein